MFDIQPSKTFCGTWDEVVSHRDEIPTGSWIEMRVFERGGLPDAENQALIDLLHSWDEEDATDDPQELERRDAQAEDLMRNLELNRLTLCKPDI